MAKFSITIVFILLAGIFTSCETEEARIENESVFYDALSQKSFDLADPIQLNDLAGVLANEPEDIKIIKNAALIPMVDSQGEFNVVSVTYQVGDIITKLSVPLTEIQVDLVALNGKVSGENTKYYMAAPCEMKCTASYPCSSCTQEIIERCMSQTCTCNNSSSGCTASIVYPE